MSAENAEYQIIRALKTKRAKRAKLNEVFIEGIEPIKQALSAELPLTRIIFRDFSCLSDWARTLIEANREAAAIEMTDELYLSLCDKENPSELLVTARVRPPRLDALLLPDKPFILIFDRPSDLGNFGSLTRSANAFGVDAVLVVGHGVDFYDPKVIRSSLGGVFHTIIVSVPSMVELETWLNQQKRKNGMELVGTDSSGSVLLAAKPLRKPIAIVLGNEAKGMSVALKALCDAVVRIPLSGRVNSLNVACAGTIFLWDVYKNSLAEGEIKP